MAALRDINPGGEQFLLTALEKIAAAKPELSAVQARQLAKQAIAYATTPRGCPGVKSVPFTHLFLEGRTSCARCGLSASDYLGSLTATEA